MSLFPPTEEELRRRDNENPMVVKHGFGPQGKTCRTCDNLVRPDEWWKCSLRSLSHNPDTDHRLRYDACSKYLSRE